MSRQIYEVVAGPLPTSLTAPFVYGADTSIHVMDATDIPDAPNIITISDVDDYFVTVEYRTKNGTELTDLLYVEGQSEHEFTVGSEVVRAVAKYDFDALKEAIDPFDIVIEGTVLPKVDAKVTIPPASEGHLGLVKPGQNVTISSDGTISAADGGTDDYEDLENKPKINSVELIGNKSISDLGLASASDLQTHIADTTNPHAVTKAQVGLGNVDNTSDADKPISTLTQAALDGKVDAETGKGLSSNDFTTTLKNKLDGIEAGAQVNVKSDWTATSGSTQEILNKPTALSSFTNDSGFQTSTQVTNSITSHNLNGSAHQDIRYALYDKEPAFDKNTAFNKNFGTESGTVCEGNDSRLSDARDPTAHVSTHKPGGADALYSTATGTLTTTGWFYGSQTIIVSGVTSTNTVIVAPAPDSIDDWIEAGCKCTRQSSNTLTFECEEVPTTTITVNVMVMI